MKAKTFSVNHWFMLFSFFLMAVFIHSSYASMNSVSIDTGTPGSLTNVTISPDGDGTDDRANVHFTSDVSGSFKVMVDTNGTPGFQMPDWSDPNSWQTSDTTMEGWAGAGGPNQFMFEGRDNKWRVLPNGTYSIRIMVDEDGDWINTTLDQSMDNSLTVTIQTASISGNVTAGGNPLPGVHVNAGSQYGWGDSDTDSSGNYTISGLKAGSYHVNAQKSGYVSADYPGGDVAVTAGQNTPGINFTMSPSILVTGAITIPAAFTSFVNMWGGMEDQLWININGWTDDGSDWVWGNAHIHAADGQFCLNALPGDDFDNDGKEDPVECSSPTSTTYSLDVKPPASGQTKTYHIRAEANNYASVEYTVTVNGSGGAQDITMTKASRIFGTVTLPSANAGSTPLWINVNARTASGTMAWGGGSVDIGQTQGNFDIRSALEGTYTVEVQVMGYKTSSVSSVVVTAGQDTDLGNISISQGGTISGIITIAGDTGSYQMYPGDPGTQPIMLWVDAGSSDGSGWSGTQVQIPRGLNQSVSYTIGGLGAGTYEIHSWLGEGYEQTPMPLTATLAGDTSNATGVDMSFAPYSGKITGTVSGTGLDLSKVVVRAMKAGWGWQQPVTTQPSGDGSYTLTGLGTSEYILEVNEYVNSADMLNGAQPMPTGNFGTETVRVPVTNGETTSGQNVTLSAGGVITGSISLEPGYSGSVNFNTDLVGKMVTAMPMKMAMMGGSSMFMGPILPDGTYTISGLGAGAYSVSPPTELTDQMAGFDPNAQMMQAPFEPDIAADSRMVSVSSGQTKSGVDFVLSDGYSVSGTLTLPDIPTGDQWNYVCEIELRHPRKEGMGRHMPVFVKDFNGTKTYSFTLEHIMDGDYVIQAWSNNYTVAYKNISVNDSDVAGANLELKKGASITGTLVNASSGKAVTPSDGIRVRCEAYPWVEGSWRETMQDPWSTSRFTDQGGIYTGAFTLANLPAGTYVVTVEAEHGMKENGAKNYIGIRKAGVVVPETSGASVDIGTLELHEGVSISGTVTSESTGAPLGNIDVEAMPVDGKDGSTSAFATTDSKGNYTIYGVDPNVKYYTVIAGSRPDFMKFIPVTWGEVEKDVEVASAGLTGVDFALPAANATLSGTIHKTGSSPWMLPFMEDDMPAPFILLQKQGEVYSDPMGGIDTIGEPSDGDTTTFSISGIVPGTYNLKIFSRGYTTKIVRGIVIAEGDNVISTALELVEGGTVSGSVVKDDGTYPTTSEVSEVVAVSEDLEVLIFGTLTANEASREVSAYSISGLEAGKSYRLVFISEGDKGPGEVHVMPDMISAGNTYNAVLGDNAPIITARAKKNADGTFSIGIFSTSYFNDASASNILSLSQGGGTLTATLGPDKMTIDAGYTPDAADTIFTLALTAHYGKNNNTVSASFSYDVNSTAWNQGTVNTLMGGMVGLGQGDKSKVFMEPGDVTDGDGDGVSTVTMQKDDSGVSGNGVHANSVERRSLLAEATDPLPAGATAASALYDIALPSGDSITTGASVTVSLQYNDSVTDTTNLHIYHFTGGAWVAEDTNLTIDTVNKTLTADVTSLSPFQVVTASSVDTPTDTPADTPAAVSSGGGGGGGCSLASNPVSMPNGIGETALMILPLLVLVLMKLRRRSQDQN